MTDPLHIGPYRVAPHHDLARNMTHLVVRGPTFRRGQAVTFSCQVSGEALEQYGYATFAPTIERLFNQALEDAYRHAPIMRRKMRRFAKGLR